MLTTRFAKDLPKPLVLPHDRKGAEILHDRMPFSFITPTPYTLLAVSISMICLLR
jgi:hypothetical protein